MIPRSVGRKTFEIPNDDIGRSEKVFLYSIILPQRSQQESSIRARRCHIFDFLNINMDELQDSTLHHLCDLMVFIVT